ncbi:hypothetical protein HWV62_29698 [Athelia sp. TMB]|nr:hypothetical protein HWV62_29698 [Athelia sp. TMB]
MDDDLVLNLATDNLASSSQGSNLKKGGRWTDRAKAKRVAKRKTRPTDKSVSTALDGDELEARPAKRPRKEPSHPAARSDLPSRPPTSERPIQNTRPPPPSQIISSLFTYNPKIDAPISKPTPKTLSKPSNAALTDGSAFSALGLDPLIIAHLATKMNVLKPTSIQRATLPVALSTAEDMASRDLFIQSQTGSGKTLSFLLPIIQDLLPLSTLSYIDRSIGTLAIIIAPTRELAKQISDVLEALLKLRLRPENESAEDPASSTRLTRWLVSGLLTGGATRTHEKARLRKGLPFIVSTPGRLLDHLQNTTSFNVGKCRWLVLDEADRLMELGFEETITGIIKGLDGRRNLAKQAMDEGKGTEVGGWDWSRRRRTILCSATIREDVQKLAGTALVRPLMIKGSDIDNPSAANETSPAGGLVPPSNEKFTPPSQLTQNFAIIPLKLRLVALVALLRSLLSQANGRRGTKIIVFLSCTDSVDFHWNLLGGSTMDGEDEPESSESDSDSEDGGDSDADTPSKPARTERIAAKSSLLPDASIFRLHGSLPTPTRLASLRGFSAVPNAKSKQPIAASSILLCTSVASRGLDLPLVRAVIQYDLPTEGGATEYVHRVGRTARAGKGGEAWSFVAPSEAEWVKWVEGKMQGDTAGDAPETDKLNITLNGIAIENILRNGFGGQGADYEERATDVQLSFERWVLRRKENADAARKAYLSHMRAYATHPSNEKHIFHIRHLHLGHLAKAFALRDAPTNVRGGSNSKGRSQASAKNSTKPFGKPKASASKDQASQRGKDWDEAHDPDAERRMQEIVRSQGRLTKRGGVMMSSGTSEFQIATEISDIALTKTAEKPADMTKAKRVRLSPLFVSLFLKSANWYRDGKMDFVGAALFYQRTATMPYLNKLWTVRTLPLEVHVAVGAITWGAVINRN